METYTIYQAKTQLSKLIRAALSGKRVVIAHRDVPQVELIPLNLAKKGRRKLGIVSGKWFMAEDFDQTPEDFKEYLK